MRKARAPRDSWLNYTYVKSKIFPKHTRANLTEIVRAAALQCDPVD